MASIQFDSPTTTTPLVTEPSSFQVQVSWSMDGTKPDAKAVPLIQLSGVPAPLSITPPAMGQVTVGGFNPGSGQTFEVFTVNYDPTQPAPISATLTATLFANGDPTQPATSVAQATINVDSSVAQNGSDALVAAVAPKTDAKLPLAKSSSAGTKNLPFVITGRSTPPTCHRRAAAVVCVVLDPRANPQTNFTKIKAVANGTFLPKDFFVITLDPAVRGKGLVYYVYLVDKLGDIKEILTQPIA